MLPIIITNDDPNDIKDQITAIMKNPNLEIILFIAPYISSYFVKMVEMSKATRVLALINDNAPKYTKKAMNELLDLDYTTIIRKKQKSIVQKQQFSVTKSMQKSIKLKRRILVRTIKKGSDDKKRFVHMKLLIPYFLDKTNDSITPKYAFSGSVNWTANGIQNNDEILIILRDKNSVNKCVAILEKFWENGEKYNQTQLEKN